MVDGLCSVVRGDIQTELIDNAHSNAILLRQVHVAIIRLTPYWQMFTEAEKWHLKLHPDISLLEQRFARNNIFVTRLFAISEI